jgi:two-component system, NarL family, response regulator LiaR
MRVEPEGAWPYSDGVPIRVAIVNDYEVVVHGIASMLRSHTHRVDVVELNASSRVAGSVDIALFDTFTQSRDDGTGVGHLLDNPAVGKVVVYTWSTDHTLRESSLRLGVAGYLSKRLSATELVMCLEKVHHGEVVVSEEPARLPLIGGDWPGREEGLTARESEVLCLITQGLTNAQIVERTQLSINSIKSYIRSCYRKIGVDSRSRAVLWGVDHGMQLDRVRIFDPEIAGTS